MSLAVSVATIAAQLVTTEASDDEHDVLPADPQPDGTEREVLEASSPTALGALIHEITARREAGDSDELATLHDEDDAPPGMGTLSVRFDIFRMVDGESRPGLTDDEKEEMFAEVRRRGEASGSGAYMEEGP